MDGMNGEGMEGQGDFVEGGPLAGVPTDIANDMLVDDTPAPIDAGGGISQETFDAALTKRLSEKDAQFDVKMTEFAAQHSAVVERLARYEGAQAANNAQNQPPVETGPTPFEYKDVDGLGEDDMRFVNARRDEIEQRLAHERQAMSSEFAGVLQKALEPFAGLRQGMQNIEQDRRYNMYDDAMKTAKAEAPWLAGNPVAEDALRNHIAVRSGSQENVTPQWLQSTMSEYVKSLAPTFARAPEPSPRGMVGNRGSNSPVAAYKPFTSWDGVFDTTARINESKQQDDAGNWARSRGRR